MAIYKMIFLMDIPDNEQPKDWLEDTVTLLESNKEYCLKHLLGVGHVTVYGGDGKELAEVRLESGVNQ